MSIYGEKWDKPLDDDGKLPDGKHQIRVLRVKEKCAEAKNGVNAGKMMRFFEMSLETLSDPPVSYQFSQHLASGTSVNEIGLKIVRQNANRAGVPLATPSEIASEDWWASWEGRILNVTVVTKDKYQNLYVDSLVDDGRYRPPTGNATAASGSGIDPDDIPF